jgi:hypothetical protein
VRIVCFQRFIWSAGFWAYAWEYDNSYSFYAIRTLPGTDEHANADDYANTDEYTCVLTHTATARVECNYFKR